jgi:hypothetical protein
MARFVGVPQGELKAQFDKEAYVGFVL